MTQRRARRNPHSADTERNFSNARREAQAASRGRFNQWNEPRPQQTNPASSDLTNLIERDAPLRNHTGLVLMYGPFQAEMQPQEGKGVASWLKECVRKHGLPSLVRYDYRHRAQVFRRDQFQPWLEPLLSKIPS